MRSQGILVPVMVQGLELFHRWYGRLRWRRGVIRAKRSPEVIVTMTTTHARIRHVGLAVSSLMMQRMKADRIILWLSETDPRAGDSLAFLKRRGLDIRFRRDVGVHTK